MITEEMLKAAAVEADLAIRNSLPSPEACVHCFSRRFERQMERVVQRARHPAAHKLLRRAACFFLAASLSCGSWLAVDAEARSAFFAWVRYQCESFAEYRFTGSAPDEDAVAIYEPAWIPDGYEKMKQETLGGTSTCIYTNSSGDMISFLHCQGADATSLFLVTESAPESVTVGGLPADYYAAGDGDVSNALVWLSETGDVMFCITAPLPKETLIQIAESVTEAG